MFNRILMPLDGSEEAERITGWLMGFAGNIGAEIELLAVVDPKQLSLADRSARRRDVRPRGAGSGQYDKSEDGLPSSPFASALGDARVAVIGGWDRGEPPPPFGTQVVDRAVQEARKYLRHRAQVFAAVDLKATTAVAVGDPADEIVRRGKSPDIDMIVMTTRRKWALAPGVLGSVADKVLRSTPVPLLTMHPQGLSCPLPFSDEPNIIVVPLDGSELSERAVPVALTLAKTLGAWLLFIRVVPSLHSGTGEFGFSDYPSYYTLDTEKEQAATYLAEFVERARRDGVDASSWTPTGRAASRIVEGIEDEPGALVVMSTHGASGFQRWAVGSVTGEVIRISGHPVLVLPPGAYGDAADRREARSRSRDGQPVGAQWSPLWRDALVTKGLAPIDQHERKPSC